MKLYCKFNDAARNSINIKNPTHQSPHALIATYLTRPCCAISLHQSQDGSQRYMNCDHEFILYVQRLFSQFNQYHKPHAPIAACTDHHILPPTVSCNKPWRGICLLTLLQMHLAMGMNFLGWIMIEGRQQGRSLMNMEGRHQGRRLAYQSQIPRGYNKVGSRKRKRCPSRHNKGQQKQTTHDFLDSTATIGIHNANAQQIASTLVGDHQLINSHRIHTNTYVKRERSSLKRALNNLKTSHEWRGRRVENIMA